MTDPMLFRLFWKEYRVQRGFWLSLGGLTLGLQLIIAAIPARYLDHTTWMFNLAVVFPAFYALGCGATTFALEREEGTAEQLRILAVPAGRLFLTKLVFGLVSALALLGVLSLLAFALARGQLPTGGSTGELWGFWGFALLEMLAWGLFFSLLTRRPLTAACLAAVAWLATLYASNWIGDVLLHYTRRPRAELWLLSAPCR
ncbi:MAG: ABC transporter permease, partial [Planctomycetes bacterium]|nr:ABC transporter permease [Planctomycetota bacterium]